MSLPRLSLVATLASLIATTALLPATASATGEQATAHASKHHRSSASRKRHTPARPHQRVHASHRSHGPGGTPAAANRAAPRHATRRLAAKSKAAPLTAAPLKAAATGAGSPPAMAAVLATPCENTELTPTAANVEAVRASVLCLVNRIRAQNGDAPLKLNAELVQAAEGHSQELVTDNYFAHVSPAGVTPVDRIRATGYIPNPSVGYVIGENLAWGTYSLATPQAIVAAWVASPGHLANILESKYTETGIGVSPQVPASLANGAPGATYSQEFGLIVY